jgi:uncharacterized protein (DUF433 family)
MAGKPVVKGTRIPVYIVLQMLEDGADNSEVIEAYPTLDEEDIRACLRYASKRAQREGMEDGKTVA